MKCSECGFNNREIARFCSECGNNLLEDKNKKQKIEMIEGDSLKQEPITKPDANNIVYSWEEKNKKLKKNLDNLNIKNRIQIDFYDLNKASVFFESCNSGQEALLGQLFCLCGYTIRNLTNLGDANNKTRRLLGACLLQMTMEECINWREVAIIDYPGHKGEKQFTALTTYTKNNPNCQLETKGFGFLGQGIEYYSPISVLVLFKYLIKNNLDNECFLALLIRMANRCGVLAATNELSLYNMKAFIMAYTIETFFEKFVITDQQTIRFCK